MTKAAKKEYVAKNRKKQETGLSTYPSCFPFLSLTGNKKRIKRGNCS